MIVTARNVAKKAICQTHVVSNGTFIIHAYTYIPNIIIIILFTMSIYAQVLTKNYLNNGKLYAHFTRIYIIIVVGRERIAYKIISVSTGFTCGVYLFFSQYHCQLAFELRIGNLHRIRNKRKKKSNRIKLK